MLTFKLILFTLVAVTIGLTLISVMQGRQLAYVGRTPARVQRHEHTTTITLSAMGAAVLFLEFIVLPHTVKHQVNPYLFYFHLFFALLYFCSFVALKFRYTGLRAPRVHKWLTYVCATSGLIALCSGLPMFYNLA